MKARVARFCLPGPMWYIAVCESCRWTGLSWKDRGRAEDERDDHNKFEHAPGPGTVEYAKKIGDGRGMSL